MNLDVRIMNLDVFGRPNGLGRKIRGSGPAQIHQGRVSVGLGWFSPGLGRFGPVMEISDRCKVSRVENPLAPCSRRLYPPRHPAARCSPTTLWLPKPTCCRGRSLLHCMASFGCWREQAYRNNLLFLYAALTETACISHV